MKKIIIYLIIVFPFLTTACFKDLGHEWDRDSIPEIVIDTTGIPATLSVLQFDHLKVAPTVSKEGLTAADFSYKWYLSYVMGYPGEERAYMPDPISTDAALDYVIDLQPTSGSYSYSLWLQVTDKTGLRKDFRWSLLVLSAYGDGLVIADTKDGSTTDLTLIEGRSFTEAWTQDDRISRNLYSVKNGEAYAGLITNLSPGWNANSTGGKRLYGITAQGDFVVVSAIDYSLIGKNHDLSYDDQMVFKATQALETSTSSYSALVTDGKIYPMVTSLLPERFHLSMTENYSSGGVTKTNYVDKYVAYVHGNGTWWGIWYDKNNGAFIGQKSSYPNYSGVLTPTDKDASSNFDPLDVPGRETLYAAVGSQNEDYFLMKYGSTYEIYTVTNNTGMARDKITIPGSEIAQAKFFAVSERTKTVFFADQTAVYAIILSGGTPTVKKMYSVSSGEITAFSVFRQAWYLRNPSLYVSGVGYKVPIANHETMLLLGVSSGNSGTLYELPLLGADLATVDNSKVISYSGFGKILSISAQE
ncbi:MAG: hypothetical protein LBR67_11570 [Dysgonamonadaceae bacterium]|jgi:hypothetical protein|nr:hypothetical protein [Dysgonamonadaceae bacterium]